MMTKKLSLIQIELGSKYLTDLEKPESNARVVAIYMAPTSVLRASRTDPAVLDSYVQAAEEMDAEEALACVTDFFGQWSRFQGSILSSAALNATAMAERVMTAKGPKVASEATPLTDTIQE